MEPTVLNIDPAGYYVLYGLLTAVAAALFYVVYGLLRRPASRRDGFRTQGAFSRPVSIAVACAVALPIAVYAHFDCWSHFFSAKAGQNGLTLQYRFPPRVRTVPLTEPSQARFETDVRKGGLVYRLAVTAADGTVHTSQQLSRDNARRCAAAMRDALGIAVGLE